jgi:hypothetical protein
MMLFGKRHCTGILTSINLSSLLQPLSVIEDSMLLSQFTFKLNNIFHYNNPTWPLIAHFAWAMATLCESRMLPA